MHSPGRYHVVADPQSFESLPEYGGGARRQSTYSGSSPSLPRRSEDPDVVILKCFEDPAIAPLPPDPDLPQDEASEPEDRRASRTDSITSYATMPIRQPTHYEHDPPQLASQPDFPLPYSSFTHWAGFSQPPQPTLPTQYYPTLVQHNAAQYPSQYTTSTYEYARLPDPPISYMQLPCRRASGPVVSIPREPESLTNGYHPQYMPIQMPLSAHPTIGPPPSRATQPRRSQSMYDDASAVAYAQQQQQRYNDERRGYNDYEFR